MSGVKLFGKTIQLPPEAVEAAEICEPADQSCAAAEDPESRLIQSGPRQDDPNEESKDPNAELDKTTLKKPDKILPCPRCNSNETKFCYFNNYNVNQPRHFCRNCQRYWTAGGTMRKVPVGAGRRKNKNILASASQFCPLTVPINHPNGTILAFNSETSEPLCESMVSVLSIVDKTVEGDDQSSGPSYSSSKDEVPVFHGPTQPYPWQNPNVQWTSAFDPAGIPLPCYPATPLPYLAGPTVWNLPFLITPAAAMSSSTLGKHPRDEEDIPTTKKESGGDDDDNLEKKCLWVPKTLRIDECGSSILTTLGIKSDTTIREDDDDDCARVGGLFKAFQCRSKGGDKTTDEETPTVLQANPAALSRSVSYHESS